MTQKSKRGTRRKSERGLMLEEEEEERGKEAKGGGAGKGGQVN